MNAIERKMESLIDTLEEAVKNRNKDKILKVYDEYQANEEIDESKVNQALLDEFDELVDRANDVLGL